MNIYRILFRYLQQYSIPVMKSVFRAYKQTTGGASNNKSQLFGNQFFDSILAKTTAPPIDATTALKILDITPSNNSKEIDPKYILHRYYILFKKNDPSVGGTHYLQNKVFAAKECLMNEYPNAVEIQSEFYHQVVEPEQKDKENEENK